MHYQRQLGQIDGSEQKSNNLLGISYNLYLSILSNEGVTQI